MATAKPSDVAAASEEVEEGELEGEMAPEQQQQAGPKDSPPNFQFTASARAPFFFDEDSQRSHEKAKAKKPKKKKKNGAAAGYYDVYGPQAVAGVEVRPEEGPVRLSDVQNLLLWVLAEGTNPRWCFVKNKPLVKRVVALALHGLHGELYSQKKHLLPTLDRLGGEPVELQARNATLVPAQTVHSFFTVPQTKKRRREEEGAARAAAQTGAATDASPLPPPQLSEGQQQADAAAAGEAAGAEDDGTADGEPSSSVGAAEAADGPPGTAELAPPSKRQRVRSAGDVASAGANAASSAPAQQAQLGAQRAAGVNGAEKPSSAQAPKFYLGVAPASARQSNPFPPSHYVLTLEQMKANNYPLPQLDENGELLCPEGFVATKPCGGTPKHSMVALDCEMCITEAGFELTRATVIDEQGQVLVDELVVPERPITDYNTRYSGITAEMLQGVSTRLEDVQALLLELVAAETLVVTHSGENDLQALKLIHANMLDTSVMFPHPKGPPYKSALRVLASRHLLRTIQREAHDPVEDARAALDLALLKIERGPSYGVASSSDGGEKLPAVLTAHGRRCTMVDSQAVLGKFVVGNCSAVIVEGDAEASQALVKEAGKWTSSSSGGGGSSSGGTSGGDMLWGQLLALHHMYEKRVAQLRESGQPEPSQLYLSEEWEAGEDAVLQSWDATLASLEQAVEPGTLFVVFSGQGDTVYTRYLLEQKYRRQQGLDEMPPWVPSCEQVLAGANAEALRGLCWAFVKS